MKKLLIVCAMASLIGCAHKPNNQYIAPSSVAVIGAVNKATGSVADLKKYVRPEGTAAVRKLEDSLFDTQVSLSKYVAQVDEQARDLYKAEEQAKYWHDKQTKALKELWTWRLIALSAILCVVLYVGIKTSWRFLI